MLELKKVTMGKEEKRGHICLPCYCFPNPCTPMIVCLPDEPLPCLPKVQS
jgi:hypothetical protein